MRILEITQRQYTMKVYDVPTLINFNHLCLIRMLFLSKLQHYMCYKIYNEMLDWDTTDVKNCIVTSTTIGNKLRIG